MKKRALALAVALFLVIVMPAYATEYLNMATGGTGGTYYALGGDIANLLTQNVEGIDVTAQTTGGSAVNIRMIDSGEAELATVQNDVATYAYQGIESFAGEQITSFAVIGNLYPEVVQFAYTDDAGISTIADLKGKSISIGAAGSGVYQNAIDFLTVAGLTLDDVEEQYLSFSESTDAIKNRQIAGGFVTAGIPNPAIQDLAATQDIELLSLSDEMIATLCAQRPYTAYTIPAGTYDSQSQDAKTVSINAILICSADMDEDLVYNITKTLYEKTEELSHAKKAEIKLETALTGFDPAMLHPGAARYYAEKGLL
jgi:TRAP transporter TAXI family solute receptor